MDGVDVAILEIDKARIGTVAHMVTDRQLLSLIRFVDVNNSDSEEDAFAAIKVWRKLKTFWLTVRECRQANIGHATVAS